MLALRQCCRKKYLSQWFLKITDYADRLLQDLDKLDGWPDSVKVMQKNWIGKSHGAIFKFKVKEIEGLEIPVYTTRPDTVFGITYLVVAPEYKDIDKLTTPENKESVKKYRENASRMTEIERLSTERIKTGVPLGTHIINPFNGEESEIWVADYALADYGTGAVMAVPAHDERDFAFAKKYNKTIKRVIDNPENPNAPLDEAYTEHGVLVNSAQFTGMKNEEAKSAITKYAEEQGFGKETTQFRLRDWLISRQRYWGAPIPIIYCPHCGMVPVPEEDLPVLLPKDVDFSVKGKSPILTSPTFLKQNARFAVQTLSAKLIQWIHLCVQTGIITGILMPITTKNLFPKKQPNIGHRLISTLAVLSMQFCIYFMQDFSQKQYMI